MSFVKSAMRRMLPRTVVLAYDGYREERLARRNRRMTTEEVFTDIYSNNRWGGPSGTFCSGDGSHENSIVSPYVAKISAELGRIGAETMTVVDLGCGDYSVGRQLSPACGRYIGVDIVKPLVAHNQAAFGSATVSFRHTNVVEDALPDGDICFVRQVLQHLSNDQITAVLPKLNKFRWCFITEHHPSPDRLRRPNEDKPHGDNIRISRGSGVFLDESPFSIPAARYRLLLEVPGAAPTDAMDAGVIRTYMLTGGPSTEGNSSRASQIPQRSSLRDP
jgi:Methyltransferase domain